MPVEDRHGHDSETSKARSLGETMKQDPMLRAAVANFMMADPLLLQQLDLARDRADAGLRLASDAGPESGDTAHPDSGISRDDPAAAGPRAPARAKQQ